MPPQPEWLEPWYAVDDPAICAELEAQLKLEVSRKHALFAETARLIARRGDTDDALFALEGGRVAVVHLTWKKGPEPNPRWPVTAIFDTIEEWARKCMVPLHRETAPDQ